MATGIVSGIINNTSVPDPSCINEQGLINSQINVRASQIEGINLMVELKPSQQRKIIREQVRRCFEEEEVLDEFQSTNLAGKRLGIDLAEDDVQLLQRMIQTETRDFKSLLKSSSAC